MEMSGGKMKEEKEIIKWLGVWIDNKLSFRTHVREKTARATRAAQKVVQLSRGSQGLGVESARRMYIACAYQVAEYGSKVWWKGQKELAQEIDKTNTQAMRKIGWHFRSAPTTAMEVENDMIPTAHRLDHKVHMQAIRSMKHNPNHPTNIVYQEQAKLLNTVQWKAKTKKEGRKRRMRGGVNELEKIVEGGL